MDHEEAKKLQKEVADCFSRLDEATKKFHQEGSRESRDDMERIQDECQLLRKKYQDWRDS